jgi:hypothetical protein
MVAPGRNPLSGLVEVDKTEITCRGKNDAVTKGGSSHDGKMLVVGAVEVRDLRPGRIRLTTVPDDSAASLHAFLAANLAPVTTAQASGEAGYCGAPGINQDPRVIGALDPQKMRPRVQRIFSDLEVWALSVYHGLRRKHFQSYLDEFVFRFNRRRNRDAAFLSLLGLAAAHPPLTYGRLASLRAKA